jgi:hypothetical protein
MGKWKSDDVIKALEKLPPSEDAMAHDELRRDYSVSEMDLCGDEQNEDINDNLH